MRRRSPRAHHPALTEWQVLPRRTDADHAHPRRLFRGRALRALLAFGTGMVVMLADTDAGSIVTAAESGARWGFELLALQIILIPVLFVVQELTVRLGILTGKGHGELIREQFGPGWAWISVAGLAVACVGAMITELSGLVGVGHLFRVPAALTCAIAVAFLLAVVWTGSYISVERVALGLGAFELIFLAIAWLAHPQLAELAGGFTQPALSDPSFLYLAAANIGAVIMPWMVFYQQSAVVDKGLQIGDLRAARWDTAIGAVVTQIIMATVIVAVATTIGRTGATGLDSIEQIADALSPFVGGTTGRALFGLAVLGAALIAALVVSLAAAWGLGEVTGYERSLEHRPRQAPWFYGVYTGAVTLSALIVLSGLDLVQLSVAIEVLNALLLPVILAFLFLLARRALPVGYRLTGPYALAVAVTMAATAGFAVVAGVLGSIGR